MFTSFCQIAKNTFREILREPIYLLVLLTALCLIGIFPVFTLFVFREQLKMVVDSAMATTMVFGWLCAVLCATHTISREIDNGTVLLLLSKPVNRPVFILAKIVGVLSALTVFWFLTTLATLISLRVAKDQFWVDNTVLGVYFGSIVLSLVIGGLHNYVTRSSYPMAAVVSLLAVMPAAGVIIQFMKIGDRYVGYAWFVVPALVLVLYSVWAMGTLATALSTRLNLVSNLLVCSIIFVIGLMSDFLIGRHAGGNWLAAVLYACIPNWQLFWMADALAAGKTVSLRYLAFGGIYIALIIALFAEMAIILLWRREVGGQMTN